MANVEPTSRKNSLCDRRTRSDETRTTRPLIVVFHQWYTESLVRNPTDRGRFVRIGNAT
jgi:hypothetical protein